MLSGYFTLSPKVEQVGSFYVVTGINTKAFESDLRTNFGTSVIFNRLITRINARSFKIHKFFMVELAWILDHLTNQKNKRTVDRYYVGLFRYKQLYDEVKTKTWLETTYQTFPSYPVDEALKEFDNNIFDNSELFSYNYLYRQQEVPQHMVDASNKAAIQIMKKMLDNLPNRTELNELKDKVFNNSLIAVKGVKGFGGMSFESIKNLNKK
jgi:hypothetical protein